ncbi:ArdC family protein [Acidobacteria bacterium AH-259-O06]|nr:ArdC family protein [Acidobacteria bacterium AH-259-O06]
MAANSLAYEVITNKILEKLEQGIVPWRQPWSTEMPKNVVSKREYRGINVFMLGCMGYANPYWLTFKQAKALGGHVRRGEKSTPVVFWKVYEQDTGEVTEDGEPVIHHLPVLRYYNVFNVQQCEDIPEDKIPAQENVREFHPIEQAEKTVQRTCPNVQRLNLGQHRRITSLLLIRSTCPRQKSSQETPNFTAPSFMS